MYKYILFYICQIKFYRIHPYDFLQMNPYITTMALCRSQCIFISQCRFFLRISKILQDRFEVFVTGYIWNALKCLQRFYSRIVCLMTHKKGPKRPSTLTLSPWWNALLWLQLSVSDTFNRYFSFPKTFFRFTPKSYVFDLHPKILKKIFFG